MAREDHLTWPGLDDVTKAAQAFLDPVLAGGSCDVGTRELVLAFARTVVSRTALLSIRNRRSRKNVRYGLKARESHAWPPQQVSEPSARMPHVSFSPTSTDVNEVVASSAGTVAMR